MNVYVCVWGGEGSARVCARLCVCVCVRARICAGWCVAKNKTPRLTNIPKMEHIYFASPGAPVAKHFAEAFLLVGP